MQVPCDLCGKVPAPAVTDDAERHRLCWSCVKDRAVGDVVVFAKEVLGVEPQPWQEKMMMDYVRWQPLKFKDGRREHEVVAAIDAAIWGRMELPW